MFTILATVFIAAVGIHAETHTVHFTNLCGFGTPTLIQGPNVLSTGGDYTINGPLEGAIAYLQTGACGFNGEGCTVVETTLANPTTGNGSSTEICTIPPQTSVVQTGFVYYNGCDGEGSDSDTCIQVTCQADNVNLEITFCDSGSGIE